MLDEENLSICKQFFLLATIFLSLRDFQLCWRGLLDMLHSLDMPWDVKKLFWYSIELSCSMGKNLRSSFNFRTSIEQRSDYILLWHSRLHVHRTREEKKQFHNNSTSKVFRLWWSTKISGRERFRWMSWFDRLSAASIVLSIIRCSRYFVESQHPPAQKAPNWNLHKSRFLRWLFLPTVDGLIVALQGNS